MNNKAVKELTEKLLIEIDPNPTREGLKDTPKRVAKFWEEFLQPQTSNKTTFNENMASVNGQIIVQRAIPFYSLCEHHLVPFFGTVAIGYLPDKRLMGLSKFSRIVDECSRRLQNQERLTSMVLNSIDEGMGGLQHYGGAIVMVEARHLCMEMRGIRKTGVVTQTISTTGKFTEDTEHTRQFFNLVNLHYDQVKQRSCGCSV